MSKRTRNVVIVTGAAALLLGALFFILRALFGGGTPIIIRGFGDPGGDLTVEGSPTLDANQSTSAKKDHSRLATIENLYILESGKCVIYKFGKTAEPEITVNVKGSPKEIDLKYSVPPTNTNPVYNLVFDEAFYTKTGSYYKRTSAAVIETVTIDPGTGTECTDKDKNPIQPCPTEFKGSGQITIAVNYYTKPCQ